MSAHGPPHLTNRAIAERLLAGITSGDTPRQVAALFAPDAAFEVPGDDGALPWIGHRTGREAAAAFVTGTRALLEPISFEVDDILSSDSRAVVVGELASRVRATEKVVETGFAIVLTIGGGLITRFQMFEDSFAVSRAACRP